MLIKRSPDIRSSEITPKDIYLNRRRFLAGLPLVGAGLMGASRVEAAKLAAAQSPLSTKSEKVSSMQDATTYNNYYEFGTSKEEPARNAHTLKPAPWSVAVEGEVAKPKVFDIDALLKLAPLEERIYRMRCVEGWSIVVPWIGYSLSALIKQVEPTAKAKFRFHRELSTRWPCKSARPRSRWTTRPSSFPRVSTTGNTSFRSR